VVQADASHGFTQLFRKLVQSFQMVGGRWYFGLAALEELLVPLVYEPGNFAAEQVAGFSENACSAVVSLFDGGGDVQLLQEHSVLCAGCVENVKAMLAQPGDSFIIGWWVKFLGHSLPDSFLAHS